MFSTFEIVKKLCEKQGISLNDLEIKLGFPQNTLYGLKKGNPKSDRIMLIADYFGVTTDYLLGRDTTDDLQRFFRIDMSQYNEADREYVEKELEEFHNLLMSQINKKKNLRD